MRRLLGGTCVGLVLLFALCSCGGGSSSSSSSSSSGSTGTIYGTIVDYDDGGAVSGATVTVGSNTTTTDSEGQFEFSAVAVDERVIVSVALDGYADQSKIVVLTDDEDTTTLTIQMLPVDYEVTFSGASDANLQDPNSDMSVSIPANSLVDANGNVASTITASLTLIDPSQSTEIMPGDFTTDGEDNIESFGAINVVFEDASGESLQLAEGTSSTIRIPANSLNGTLPTTIPLFYYDEETGTWVAEGTATLVDNGTTQYYEGTVEHFSTWNCDEVYDRVYIHGCVEDLEGNRVPGVNVFSRGVDYSGSASSTSNSDGSFSVYAKMNANAIAYASQGGTYSNQVAVVTGTADYTMPDCLVFSNEGSVSITLTWGATPSDLDSHLTGPDYHIYFGDEGDLFASPYAQLDVDDTDSYGPEIITVTRFESAGTYRYSVHNFSGTAQGITNSPARVELNVDGNITIFTPPSGEGSNMYWNVFNLNVDANGSVSVETLNTWSDAE